MWNIKALALTIQKLLASLKFQRGGQNDRPDKNNMPPDLGSRGYKKKIKNNHNHYNQKFFGKMAPYLFLMYTIFNS